MSKHGSDATPFATLTPDRVLDAIESTGRRCDGRVMALNSFENRVYQAGLEDGGFVIAKFYRPRRWSDAAIQEEHDFTRELAEREIPVVPPLLDGATSLHKNDAHRFALFPRQGGRAPEFDQAETLTWMGRFLGRIHAVGGARSFAARPALDIAGFGEEPRDFLLDQGFVAPELETVWAGVVDQALDGVHAAFERAGAVRMLRLHGDCHQGNVLWTAHGPHFVDFDDSRMGPAVQDIWMLLSGDRETMERQLGAILRGYEQFREFDDRELQLIEALRTLRLIHYSAWIARRWRDPAFPAAFPWFGTTHYWQERILELREQIALLNESPLRPV